MSKNRVINIRLSKEEHLIIKSKAESRELSMSQYIRQKSLLNRDLSKSEKKKMEDIEINIKKIGININQISKNLNIRMIYDEKKIDDATIEKINDNIKGIIVWIKEHDKITRRIL